MTETERVYIAGGDRDIPWDSIKYVKLADILGARDELVEYIRGQGVKEEIDFTVGVLEMKPCLRVRAVCRAWKTRG